MKHLWIFQLDVIFRWDYELRSMKVGILVVCTFIVMFGDACFAWGERGHNIVTRVAVRSLAMTESYHMTLPFEKKEFMLAHLSNVPDIVWRGDDVSRRDRLLNGPTHYFNLDSVVDHPKQLIILPLTYSKFASFAKDRNLKLATDVGTAPWRVEQLYKEITRALVSAGDSEGEAFINHVNQALLYAGIMSHFVADLANPHHTTQNHDGHLSGNDGLHAYFETHVVNELDLTLLDAVFQRASKADYLEDQLSMTFADLKYEQIRHDPLQLIFALIINSYQNVSRLHELDNKYSLLKRRNSRDQSPKRKPAREVVDDYQEFVIDRLALGAAVLSELWVLAWQKAGGPDLSRYHSFVYPVRPDFIYPDYLNSNS